MKSRFEIPLSAAAAAGAIVGILLFLAILATLFLLHRFGVI